MDKITFQFKISPEDYRKMSYFNTFSLKKAQSLLVVLVWVAAVTLLLLDVFGVIAPTEIMHLCFIIVTVAVPLLVVAAEVNVRRFRSREAEDTEKLRTLVFQDDGLHFYTEKSNTRGFQPWSDFLAAYETRSLFLLYKDANHIVYFPKRNEPAEKLAAARACLTEKMGKRFRLRT